MHICGNILNLTPESMAWDQELRLLGVIEPQNRAVETKLLTMMVPTDPEGLRTRAQTLARRSASEGCRYVIVGGSTVPYLMPELIKALKGRGMIPVYEYRREDRVELALPEGEGLINGYISRHGGFIRA